MKSMLLALALLGAPPTVDIPPEVKPSGQYVMLSPKTDATAITYVGLSGLDPLPSAMLKDARMFVLDTRGLPVGNYKFVAVASHNDEHARIDFVVVIGQPPGPGPVNPQPPAPGTPVTGMRVLILHESSPASALSKSQVEALNSPEVMAYLDQKARDPATGLRRWRKLDPQAPVSNLPKSWQDMRAKAEPPSPDQPWVIVAGTVSPGSPEQIVFSGPYPPTAAEALALLKKYGG